MRRIRSDGFLLRSCTAFGERDVREADFSRGGERLTSGRPALRRGFLPGLRVPSAKDPPGIDPAAIDGRGEPAAMKGAGEKLNMEHDQSYAIDLDVAYGPPHRVDVPTLAAGIGDDRSTGPVSARRLIRPVRREIEAPGAGESGLRRYRHAIDRGRDRAAAAPRRRPSGGGGIGFHGAFRGSGVYA